MRRSRVPIADLFVLRARPRASWAWASDAPPIALQAAPGTITDQELEHEPGGSGLRYSFDLKRGRKTFEVGVDAKTGAVLENKIEGPNPD